MTAGFVGKRSAPEPVELDLVGFCFPAEHGEAVVTGPSLAAGYVDVDTPRGPSCRVASQVREASLRFSDGSGILGS